MKMEEETMIFWIHFFHFEF